MKRSNPFAETDDAKVFYILVKELHMSPADIADLTPIQRNVLIYNWIEEKKREEKQIKKAKQKGMRGTRRRRR